MRKLLAATGHCADVNQRKPSTGPAVGRSALGSIALAFLLALVSGCADRGPSPIVTPPPPPPAPAPPAPRACIANHRLESNASFPGLTGRVVYHEYASYGDGNAHLYLYDFKSKVRTQIDQRNWNITDPINAQFSTDGKKIVFMGVQGGNWNAFIWTVGSSVAPTNLTSAIGGRNEDPKFSFDGTKIVIKHDGDLRIGMIGTDGSGNPTIRSWINVTNNRGTSRAIEQSMPYFTTDGRSLLYTTGSSSSLRLWERNIRTGGAAQIERPPSDGADYYPIVRDSSTFLFTRVTPGINRDQLMLDSVESPGNPTQLSVNDCNADNSDPAPAGTTYAIFSSTGYSRRYSLMLGDLATGQVWRIDPAIVNLADGMAKLGASYTDAR